MLSQKYFENLEIMEVQITLQNRRFGRGVFISMISRFSKHMCRTKFSEDITAYILVYTDHFQNSHLEKLFQNLEIMEVKFTLYNYHFEV